MKRRVPRPSCFSLALAIAVVLACEFSGDRSLGTVESPWTTPSAEGGAQAQGGASATKIATEVASDPIPVPDVAPCTLDPPTGCSESQYCEFGGQGCGLGGTCQERPMECPDLSETRMTCGCDGQFHDSLCFAQQAGVAGASLGFCEPISCLQSEDCAQLAAGCYDVFDRYGVECVRGRCECAVTSLLL